MTGVCIGNSGKILKTIDGGSNWFSVISGTSLNLNSLAFASPEKGFIVGDSGLNLITIDSGTSWIAGNLPNLHFDFTTVFFLNDSLGFVGGKSFDIDQDYIYKTTNGGTSWDSLAADQVFTNSVKSIFFATPEIGWIVRLSETLGSEFIYKTTNGGINSFYQFNNEEVNTLFFIDSLKGWFAGGTTFSLVYRTINGGTNWISCFSCGIGEGYSSYFVNSNKGWIGSHGAVNHTTNGGVNWTVQNTNHIGARYYSIYFVDSTTGWTAGDSGVILKTTTGGILTGFSNTSSEIPDRYYLSQNYPNPFNPLTVIRYSLIGNQNVSLQVFDALGNEVATLIDENKPAGSYEVEFNGSEFASGVYFYRLEVDGNIVDAKRMMLLK